MTRFVWQAALCTVAVVILTGASALAQESSSSDTVELFAAIEAGQITVEVVPRDAEQLAMIVTNETDRPLTIELPGAALAQFFPQPGGQANINQNNNNSPQNLGVGFPAGQNVGQQPFGNRQGGQRLFQGAQFKVPAGATIRPRVACVCLEHGKPTPSPHHAYVLRPLSEFSENSELAALLELSSYGNYTQREMQVAAWHVTDGISWEEFKEMRTDPLRGRSRRAYSERELEQARALFDSVAQETQEHESGEASPGEVVHSTATSAAE